MGTKVVVCDYPDGRLEITDGEATLPYRTFDTLRSVHRSEVVENKRLDDMLALVAEMQAGREQQRSKSGPRRTGQTDHMFGIRDGSLGNGYQKRGTKPGRKTDFTKDPVVLAKRQQALARLKDGVSRYLGVFAACRRAAKQRFEDGTRKSWE